MLEMTLGNRAQEVISAPGQILFVFLAQQVGLIEGNDLSELTAARVTIAYGCAKRVCYVKKTLVEFLAEHEVGLVEGNSLSEMTAARVTIACESRKESMLCKEKH
jgi:hypothetical protein